MFYKFDAWILGHVQRFSHRWQRLTGLTNFWIANVLLSMAAIGYGTLAAVKLISGDYRWGFLQAVVAVFWTPIMLWLMRRNEEMEAHYLSGCKAMHPFTLFILCQVWRRVFIVFLVAYTDGLALLMWRTFEFCVLAASLGCYSIALYCMACIPLPPGKSKVRQLVESLVTAFRKPQVAYAPASR